MKKNGKACGPMGMPPKKKPAPKKRKKQFLIWNKTTSQLFSEVVFC